MQTYNVHIYREMRLYFPGIQAESHEAASRIAADKCTDEADYVEDCQGENLSALVDVEGDAEYLHTRMIDFQPALLCDNAPDPLKAMETLIEKSDDLEAATRKGIECQKPVEQHMAALDAATDYFLALAEDRRPKVGATKEWLEYVSASIAWARQEIERQA
jgi:hypothetical protein